MIEPSITELTEQFMDRLGEPALQFVAPTGEINIPNGILACCRVVHQAHCVNHVAVSLTGAVTNLKTESGEIVERIHPRPISSTGDVLSRPTELYANTKAHWMVAQSTAKALDAEVVDMTIAVFLLTPEQSAAWQELERRIDAYAEELQVNIPEPTRISMLPYAVIPDPAKMDEEEAAEIREVLDNLRQKAEWRGIDEYAALVTVWPGEIGHDDQYRYIVGEVTAPEGEATAWMGDPNDPLTRPMAEVS